jgi:hypothetical protein
MEVEMSARLVVNGSADESSTFLIGGLFALKIYDPDGKHTPGDSWQVAAKHAKVRHIREHVEIECKRRRPNKGDVVRLDAIHGTLLEMAGGDEEASVIELAKLVAA